MACGKGPTEAWGPGVIGSHTSMSLACGELLLSGGRHVISVTTASQGAERMHRRALSSSSAMRGQQTAPAPSRLGAANIVRGGPAQTLEEEVPLS